MKSDAQKVVRVGLVGCGVVGTGLLTLLQENAAVITGRLGVHIEVVRIAVRDASRTRDAVVPQVLLTERIEDVLEDASIQIVIELMGGVARAGEVVRAALESGKHVITANKALLAERGEALFDLAEEKKLDLYYEAAVAGGIPIIRVLCESLAADQILSLRGIVNGTSNYILSRMTEADLGFQEALAEAQAAGYAEADPTLDVGGGDACHKLAIMATLAFGVRVSPEDIPTEGIDKIEAIDMTCASRFGYVIKPLAIGKAITKNITDVDGTDAHKKQLDLRVHPAFVDRRSPLAAISGATNAIALEGAMVGPVLLSGPGAGGGPTATSVAGDLVDVVRNLVSGAHGRVAARGFQSTALCDARVRPLGERHGRNYLRFTVRDESGVLSKITGALGKESVSMERVLQEEAVSNSVTVTMLTHDTQEARLRRALDTIEQLHFNLAPPRVIRIES